MDKTLDILLNSLSDDEWGKIKLIVESKNAFKNAEHNNKIKIKSISFAEWILDKGVSIEYDTETNKNVWVKETPHEKSLYTSDELYKMYFLGEWDDDNDDNFDLK